MSLPQRCATADCDAPVTWDVEIEDTGWHPYCESCGQSLFDAGHRARKHQSTTDDPVYCASPRAIEHATEAFAARGGFPVPAGPLSDALIAAHHPELGLDRSVCLRDVVDWLEGRTGAHGGGFTSADDVRWAIEREFGGADVPAVPYHSPNSPFGI